MELSLYKLAHRQTIMILMLEQNQDIKEAA